MIQLLALQNQINLKKIKIKTDKVQSANFLNQGKMKIIIKVKVKVKVRKKRKIKLQKKRIMIMTPNHFRFQEFHLQ